MADDARKQLQELFARVGKKALARLHERRPDLRGKSLEDTVTILKAEERTSQLKTIASEVSDFIDRQPNLPEPGFISRGEHDGSDEMPSESPTIAAP